LATAKEKHDELTAAEKLDQSIINHYYQNKPPLTVVMSEERSNNRPHHDHHQKNLMKVKIQNEQ
jgi:hypothetical protein